jgi:hypothetical protein
VPRSWSILRGISRLKLHFKEHVHTLLQIFMSSDFRTTQYYNTYIHIHTINNNNPWRYSSDEPWPAKQPPLAVFPDCTRRYWVDMWSAHRIPQLHFQLSKPLILHQFVSLKSFKMHCNQGQSVHVNRVSYVSLANIKKQKVKYLTFVVQ